MKTVKEILSEIDRRIEYYEEREQVIVKTHPDHLKAKASLKVLRSMKKWIEKEPNGEFQEFFVGDEVFVTDFQEFGVIEYIEGPNMSPPTANVRMQGHRGLVTVYVSHLRKE